MRIRRATVDDASALSRLWLAVGLAHRPELVAEELGSVLHRDPVALRDALRAGQLDAPGQFARSFAAATAEYVEPWYRSTLAYDRG
jgi:hypothetical protein